MVGRFVLWLINGPKEKSTIWVPKAFWNKIPVGQQNGRTTVVSKVSTLYQPYDGSAILKIPNWVLITFAALKPPIWSKSKWDNKHRTFFQGWVPRMRPKLINDISFLAHSIEAHLAWNETFETKLSLYIWLYVSSFWPELRQDQATNPHQVLEVHIRTTCVQD